MPSQLFGFIDLMKILTDFVPTPRGTATSPPLLRRKRGRSTRNGLM